MFTGLWSGQTFSKLLKVITLHWAPVSILYETGIPFEGGVTDQSKFSFLIWLIYVEFWILTVSIKIHNRSGQRVHLIRFLTLCSLGPTRGQQTLKWFFFIQTWQTLPKVYICLGDVNHRKIYIFLWSLVCSGFECYGKTSWVFLKKSYQYRCNGELRLPKFKTPPVLILLWNKTVSVN